MAYKSELDDVLKENGLTRDQLNIRCSSEVSIALSMKLERWEILAHCIGLSEKDCAAIKEDNRSYEAQCHATVSRWRKQLGSRATYLMLAEGLEKLKRRDLVEELCILYSAATTRNTKVKSQEGSKEKISLGKEFKKCVKEVLKSDELQDVISSTLALTADCIEEIRSSIKNDKEESKGTSEEEKNYGFYGPRDVLIIVSNESLEGPDIVPRKKGILTQEDKDKLTSQDIDPYCWEDDAKLMEAKYEKEPQRFHLLSVESNHSLTCQYVMDVIKTLMKTTKKPGVVIHYIGPGRKNTGDWCFEDGFIEFKDIKDVYMQYFFNKNPKYVSKCLEVTTDCSYSGKWVLDCRDFLNQFGVQPCGHSAWEANIFLKVRASCRSHQVPHSLLYSARGDDIITGMYNIMDLGKYKIEQNQHVSNIDSTFISCKKGAVYEDPCSLPDDYNWHKKSEEERVYLVRGTCGDDNKEAWWYVLIVDDEEIIELFLEKVTGRFNLDDYGQVLESGLGQDPPDEIREMIMKKYSPVAKNIREL